MDGMSCGCVRTPTRRDNDWGSTRAMCFEEDGGERRDKLVYAGPGKGGYELMSSYAYVGEGCGSYNVGGVSEEQRRGGSMSSGARKCCLGSVVVVACCAAVAYELSTGRGLPILQRFLAVDPRGAEHGALHAFDGGGGREPGLLGEAEPPSAPAAADPQAPVVAGAAGAAPLAGAAGASAGLAPDRQMESPMPPAALDTVGAGDDAGDDLASSAAGAETTTALGSEPYDCLDGYLEWERLWLPKKQAYCCLEYDFGCHPMTTPTPKPEAAHAAQKPTAQATEVLYVAKGNVAAIKEKLQSLAGCDALCVFPWGNSTCKARMQYLANRFGRPGSCKVALDTVHRDCAACSACVLEEADCHDGAAQYGGRHGSPPQRAAAAEAGGGEATTTPGGGTTSAIAAEDVAPSGHTALPSPAVAKGKLIPGGVAPADASDWLDCDTTVADYREKWSVFKTAWCCLHEQRGCPEQGRLRAVDDSGAAGHVPVAAENRAGHVGTRGLPRPLVASTQNS